MGDLRKENDELKRKLRLSEKMKERYKNEVIEISGKVEQEKARVEKKLFEERKNAFEKYCQKKLLDVENKQKVLEERNRELLNQLKESKNRTNELETLTIDLTTRNNELDDSITNLVSRTNNLEEEVKRLSEKEKELEESRKQLEDVLAGSIKECEELKKTSVHLKKTLVDERQRYADESQKAAKKISDMEDVLQISNQHNTRMTKEIDSLQKVNETLKESSWSVTRELDYHKSIMSSKDKDHIPLPADWEPMPETVNCKVFPATVAAYSMVTRRFHETSGWQVKIIKVDRIQNKCLYKQYHLKKSQISQHSRSSNEKLLWHGTHGEAVSGIVVNGFDRGYTGSNVGHAYGQGVYFHEKSGYSVDYSKDDINKEKHMFLARVLTGESTLGKPVYKVLPIKDHSSYTRYDSLVSPPTKPGIYVIMNDTQAYPEYLVTFVVTGS